MAEIPDKAWLEYGARARRELLPKLMDSSVFVSIGGPEGDADVKQATEVGYALLMGKPILMVCPRGRRLPDGLRRAADIIVDDWVAGDEESTNKMLRGIKAMAEVTSQDGPSYMEILRAAAKNAVTSLGDPYHERAIELLAKAIGEDV